MERCYSNFLKKFNNFLKVGNIVKLTDGDLVPADMVILDTNLIIHKKAVCYVKSGLVNGKASYSKKLALNLTKC